MIEAIAIDIDGTITHSNRQLDIAAVDPIRRAEKMGLRVIVATGNVLCFAEATSTLLGTTGPLIAEDGGVVYDKSEDQEYVIGNTEKVDEGVKLLEERFEHLQHTRTSKTRHAGRTLERTFDVNKALEVLREAGLDLQVVDSGFAIHIKDPEISKGNALKIVASLLGISTSEIAAIGDAPNDVEMLRNAGLSFAPSNSHPKAKAACSYALDAPHGKGVKKAITKILKERD
ncbi:hypothetical protein AKJ58_00065 [candidate division MSBL1 archaeon SCGC-AAA385D11]|uniref:Phosphoglycolate phosphatase n=1 Tax=candidate division MSBL1 archaeon SCGC-AAA385D11 TaxID=1698286 RepID=A0A133VPK5_9EURY|nr:hypothetical protein AKJ58_00065 [candidate division MSBL1 archaeon SCGC-AAA385D11]